MFRFASLLLCSLGWLCCGCAGDSAEVPLLSAGLMVKNERATLPTTMAALASVDVRDVFLYDTGSVDGTVELAQLLAEALGLTLHVSRGEFVDFATSRNVLLAHARHKSRWLLLLDAGEDVLMGADVPAVLSGAPAEHCGFMVQIALWPGDYAFFSTRLIRNDGRWRYTFPVHEFLIIDDPECATVLWLDAEPQRALQLSQNRTLTGRSSEARWLRDANVLETLLATTPDEPRALFYLANTYAQLGRLTDAVDLYLRRYAVVGWWEEREAALVALVGCLRSLERYDEFRNWAFVLYYQHQRIEGVMALARHALDVEQNPVLCFALADLACRVPQVRRSLWINQREYTEFRWNLRRWCRARIDQ